MAIATQNSLPSDFMMSAPGQDEQSCAVNVQTSIVIKGYPAGYAPATAFAAAAYGNRYFGGQNPRNRILIWNKAHAQLLIKACGQIPHRGLSNPAQAVGRDRHLRPLASGRGAALHVQGLGLKSAAIVLCGFETPGHQRGGIPL